MLRQHMIVWAIDYCSLTERPPAGGPLFFFQEGGFYE